MSTPVGGWARKFLDGETVLLKHKYMGVSLPTSPDVPVTILRLDSPPCWRPGGVDGGGSELSHALYHVEEVGTGEVYPVCENELGKVPRKWTAKGMEVFRRGVPSR